MLGLQMISYSKGFTLIEAMITVAISVILASLVVPSFLTMIHNGRIRASAQTITYGLQLARMEAVRRNTSARFTLGGTSTTAWSVVVGSDGFNTQSHTTGESGNTVTNITLTPANAVQVTFNRLGRVINNADSSATLTQLIIDVPTSILSAAQIKELRVNISSAGYIRLCNPALASSNPQGC